MEFRDLSSGIGSIIADKRLNMRLCRDGSSGRDCNALNQNVFARVLPGQSPDARSRAREIEGKLTGRGDTIET